MKKKNDATYTRPEGSPPYHPRRDRILIRLVEDPNATKKDTSFRDQLSLSERALRQIRDAEEEEQKIKVHVWEVVAVGEGTMTQSGLVPNVSKPGTKVVLTGYPTETLRLMKDLGYEGYALVQDNNVLMEMLPSEE